MHIEKFVSAHPEYVEWEYDIHVIYPDIVGKTKIEYYQDTFYPSKGELALNELSGFGEYRIQVLDVNEQLKSVLVSYDYLMDKLMNNKQAHK